MLKTLGHRTLLAAVAILGAAELGNRIHSHLATENFSLPPSSLAEKEEVVPDFTTKATRKTEAATVMVLGTSRYTGKIKGLCTGVSVGPQLILTARHCADPERELSVALNPELRTQLQDDLTARDILGHNAIIFGGDVVWRSEDHDVGILRSHARLPTWVRVSRRQVGVGSHAFFAGYGVRGRSIGSRHTGYARIVHNEGGEVWAVSVGKNGYGEGACGGDSGAGLFIETSRGPEVIAILSGGNRNCRGADLFQKLPTSLIQKVRELNP